MWNANQDMASAAFKTDYIQGIGYGTLDPTLYGGFNVNDGYYCFNGADDYRIAASRTTDPGLQAYLQAKASSYDIYNQSFITSWHVKDASSVVPFPITVKYSDLETAVATEEPPIYALIVMIPCEFLWAFLANQLVPQSPPGNLYNTDWIQPNLDASGAYKMGNYLFSYMQANPGAVDTNVANEFYRMAMTYEVQNFIAATAPSPE